MLFSSFQNKRDIQDYKFISYIWKTWIHTIGWKLWFDLLLWIKIHRIILVTWFFLFEFALMYETLWLYNGPVKIQRSFNLRITVFKLVLVMAILIHFAIYLTHICDLPITTAKFANNCIEIHVQITIKLIVFICSYRYICMYLCWYLSNIYIYICNIYLYRILPSR